MEMMQIPTNIAHFVPLDHGLVWVAPEYAEVFHQQNLTTFDGFMRFAGGQQYKKNLYREVIRLEFPSSKPMFLKRHLRQKRWDSLKSWLFLQKPKSAARQEIESIGYLEAIGVATMKPVAFGEMPQRIWEPCSFLITEEIAQGEKLERYLVEAHSKWQEDLAFRRELIRRLAFMLRNMHTHNIHHQDFYLGHILLTWHNTQDFSLVVIDLQRMRKKHRLSLRWKIKDISQLNYSAPWPLVSIADRIRFFHEYQGKPLHKVLERVMIFWINWRYRKTAQHQLHKKMRQLKRDGLAR